MCSSFKSDWYYITHSLHGQQLFWGVVTTSNAIIGKCVWYESHQTAKISSIPNWTFPTLLKKFFKHFRMYFMSDLVWPQWRFHTERTGLVLEFKLQFQHFIHFHLPIYRAEKEDKCHPLILNVLVIELCGLRHPESLMMWAPSWEILTMCVRHTLLLINSRDTACKVK